MKAAYLKLHILRVAAYSPYAVAEHAMALLLTLNRKIHKAYIRTRDFNFSLSGLLGFDLHGKTVGVVGTGRIGRVFLDICRGFGMKVLAYDPYPLKDAGIDYTDMDTLLKSCDILSLHCPLTEETRHILDARAFEKMKKGTVIDQARLSGHMGVDIAAPRGSFVRAAGDGTVIFSGWTEDLGNLIILYHGNGFFTYYGHNQRLLKLRNSYVRKADVIAMVGSSGASSAPHLHFEIWKDGLPLDPKEYILAFSRM